LNVTVSGESAILNNNNGTWSINRVNVYTNGSNAYGVYANRANINIGNGSYIATNGDGAYGVYANNGANITVGSNATIYSSGTNAYAVYANSNSHVSNTYGSLNITGDIYSSDASYVDLSFAGSSIFKGSTTANSIIDLTFEGANSLWELTGDSSVTDLTLLNGAKVDMTRGGVFLTLTPASVLNIENLYGNGVFDVRFDLKNELNDKIAVSNSSSGNHHVNFYDKTNGAFTLNHNISLLVVEQNNPYGSYAAAYDGKIDLGGIEYNLTKSNSNESWYVNLFNGTSTTGGSGGGGGGGTPTCTSAHCAVKSFLNINYLTNYIDSQAILQRVGEIREGRHDREDVWVRAYFGQLGSFEDETRVNEVNYYGIQGGADRADEYEYATTYLGWAFGYSKADIDYLKGEGRNDNLYGGIYASVLFKTNLYMDFAAKYSYNKNKFDTVTSNGYDVTGEGNARSFSVDIEAGKRYNISKFYIEPQAGVSFTNQNAADVSSSDGMRITLNKYDSYRIRGGMLLGYTIKDMANIYLKGGYTKELNSDTSYVLNGNLIGYQLNDDIVDGAAGIMLNTDNHHLYLEGNYQIGSEFDNKKANLGYRYDF
ncbi:MAG: autotransporter outer membrane beta-barrel domain-containing protein, partial [Campylobacteraceae bacterium]|nr:autotransporter outer membrane beta-barrel domain-containing protein [Campylobacteraceae bacterium]